MKAVFLLLVLVAFVSAVQAHDVVPHEQGDDGCACEGHECHCCVDVSVKKYKLEGELCVNITFVPKSMSLELTVDFNGDVIFNKTVSLEDPDVCFSVPYIPIVKLCLDFYDMSYSTTEVDGCCKLVVKAEHIDVAKINIGCFHLHIPTIQRFLDAMMKEKLLKGR